MVLAYVPHGADTEFMALEEAVGYLRLSPRPDGLYDLPMDRQKEAALAAAERRGWVITEWFIDEDRSAYDRRSVRHDYRRMFQGLKSGVLRNIVAYNIDRVYRQPRELEELIDLCIDKKVGFLTAEGDIDLSTADGRLQARILVSVACKSSDDTGRRVSLMHEQLARRGLPCGGMRPFGFKADRITHEPKEAALIQWMAREALSGRGLLAIARELNDLNVPTVRGGPWTSPTVKYMLCNPRMAGLRAIHKEVVGKAIWEPILTEEDHIALKALLRDPARNHKRHTTARRHFLSGFLVCGLCDKRMLYKPDRASGVFRAQCISGSLFFGCGHTAIRNMPAVENEVLGRFFAALDSDWLVAAVQKQQDIDEGFDIDGAIAATRNKMAYFAGKHATDAITEEEYEAAREPLAAKLAELEARQKDAFGALREITKMLKRGSQLKKRWASLNLDERRFQLGHVITAVRINPGRPGMRVFNPHRVECSWVVQPLAS